MTHESGFSKRSFPRMDALKLDRQDWLRIISVMSLALLLRVWIIANTEVCARDTIGFIRYAILLDEKPWPEVVRSMHQMPGYPAAILAASKPVLALHPGPQSEAFVLSAQIVNLLASVLTVPALYLAGRAFASRNVGLFAALLFQMLPGWLQVTSDGLSEGLFFLFLAWSFAFAISGLKSPAVWRFALAGLLSGAAYLTRPEGAELLPVVCLVTIVFGLLHWGWRTTALRLAIVLAGALPFIGGYVATTGTLTNKPTSRTLLHGEEPQAAANGPGPVMLPFAVFVDPQTQTGQSRWITALGMLGSETAKSLRYIGAVFAIAGLVVAWRRRAFDPALWLTVLLAGLHALVLCRMAAVIGYLSERHTLMLVLPSLLWAGLALERLAKVPHLRFAPLVLTIGIGLSGIGSLSKPLHHNRAGHHAAGRWLAEHAHDQDELVDPFAWAHYYSGFFFREGQESPGGDKHKYIVFEPGSDHPRLPLMPLASQLAQQSEIVYQWPEQSDSPRVVVYRTRK